MGEAWVGVLVYGLLLAPSSAMADVGAPASRLTIDQRAGALRSPQGDWAPSVLQTAVELEARWPHLGIALRFFDYQLAPPNRVVGASVGVRVPLFRRDAHELSVGMDVGGASHRPALRWALWDDGAADKGLALTGSARWTSPVSTHLRLGASVRYGGLPRTGVHWLSVGLVMTVELDRSGS